MLVIGADLLSGSTSLKFILNETGVAFFPITQQHREIKTHGLSYEDDYLGNAVAGVITPHHVEIRYHGAFSDERIRNLWICILKTPAVAQAHLGKLYYQGRPI